MRLLSRVADRLYWMARYMERAEDTARLTQAYAHLIMDIPEGTEPGSNFGYSFGSTWVFASFSMSVSPERTMSCTGMSMASGRVCASWLTIRLLPQRAALPTPLCLC